MTTSPISTLRAWPVSGLAVWAAARDAGRCAPDDVLHTLHDYAQAHELDGERSGDVLDLLDVVGYRLELVDGLWSEIGQTNDGRTAVALVGPGAWTPDDGDAASWSSAFECCLNAAGVVA